MGLHSIHIGYFVSTGREKTRKIRILTIINDDEEDEQ